MAVMLDRVNRCGSADGHATESSAVYHNDTMWQRYAYKFSAVDSALDVSA
jgi:hypothetical protein